MATLDDPRRREDLEQENTISANSQQITNQPSLSNQSDPSQRKGSGTFTPIQKYMDANANQSEKIANELIQKNQQSAKNIESQLSAKKQALNEFSSNRNNEIQNARNFSENIINNNLTPTQQELAKFQTFRKGENDLDVLPDFQVQKEHTQTQQLAQQAQQAQTEAGRQQLLNNTYGGANKYSRGMKTLDQLILGGQPEVVKDLINKTKNTGQSLQDNVLNYQNNTRQTLDSISNAVNSLTQGPKSLNEMIEGKETELKNNIYKQAENYNNKLLDTGNQLKAQLQQGFISKDVFNSLNPETQQLLQKAIQSGLTTNSFKDVNPATAVKANIFDLKNLTDSQYSQVATPEQIAQQRRLELLSENSPSFLTQQSGGGLIKPDELNIRQLIEAAQQRQDTFNAEKNSLASEYGKKISGYAYDDIGRHKGAGTIDGGQSFLDQYADYNIAKKLLGGEDSSSLYFNDGKPVAKVAGDLPNLNALKNQYSNYDLQPTDRIVNGYLQTTRLERPNGAFGGIARVPVSIDVRPTTPHSGVLDSGRTMNEYNAKLAALNQFINANKGTPLQILDKSQVPTTSASNIRLK